MLEALLAATATSGLVALARSNRQPVAKGEVWLGEDEDLPCPWCYSQTSSNDDRCGNCGRRFG